jgi:hypothetical protein
MIIDYMVAVGKDAASLSKEIHKLLEIGWQPFGSLVICGYYCQAMVQYREVIID